MRKISFRRLLNPLKGLQDPVRRPRYIIWTGVTVLFLIAFVLLALGVTSSRWFCAEGCHKVQDDTIIAYSHSSHSHISCLACHMPVNANPVTFMLHKVKALGELWLTVSNRYELPLNAESELSQTSPEMGSEQCTQCHDLTHRKITPSNGIIINHAIHAQKGIRCTVCHNRVAHNEDFTLTLAGNRKHPDFMKMTGCFRCHGVGAGAKAPGSCSVCHTPGFRLKPATHDSPTFATKDHGTLAAEETSEAAAEAKLTGEEAAKLSCYMCHDQKKFCDSCHGIQMPHPANWVPSATGGKQANPHAIAGNADPQLCAKCHKASPTGMTACEQCHHPWGSPAKTWVGQHPQIARARGVASCYQPNGCHVQTFCSTCHVTGKAPPVQ
jgi:Cytochrome c7 and related cytochrome c